MMLWCDFTTQMNELVDQILPYGRFAWGNYQNRYETIIGNVNFETVNTVGEDRLVRATIPLTVYGTLLSAQETQIETLQKAYSIKKVSWNTSLTTNNNVNLESTITPSLSGSSAGIKVTQ